MLERHGKGKDHVHVDEGLDHACEDERLGVKALDANHEVTHRADDALEDAKEQEEQQAAKVALPGGKASLDALLVHLGLIDGDEDKAAHPQSQVGVEGRHARAIVGNREDGLLV